MKASGAISSCLLEGLADLLQSHRSYSGVERPQVRIDLLREVAGQEGGVGPDRGRVRMTLHGAALERTTAQATR